MGRHLLLEWGWGHMSAPSVQKAAMKAEQDGLTQPLIRSLASLGQHGSCPRNIQRQLMNRFCSHIHPDRLVKEITVPGMSITSMLFPHELFHEIRMKAPQQFIHRFGAVEAKCAAFWQALCQSPPGLEVFNRHPHLQAQRDKLHRIIPLVCHMDAGPYSKSHDSAVGFSMSSPLGIGDEAETVFMLASWLKNKVD